MASGFSALAAAIVVRARKDYGRYALLPHNAVYVLLGAGLLWFGWFGFNGGSAYGIGRPGILAFVNTLLAPACTLVVWILLDLCATAARRRSARRRRSSSAASGSPRRPATSARCGRWRSARWRRCQLRADRWRARTRLDETLDVLAAHGAAGLTGIVFIGLAAQKSWNGLADGLFYGHAAQLGYQASRRSRRPPTRSARRS